MRAVYALDIGQKPHQCLHCSIGWLEAASHKFLHGIMPILDREAAALARFARHSHADVVLPPALCGQGKPQDIDLHAHTNHFFGSAQQLISDAIHRHRSHSSSGRPGAMLFA